MSAELNAAARQKNGTDKSGLAGGEVFRPQR
ncbi:hypothetical protein EM595_p0330 (plasmid) [Duffyella gerundensis]|uniref:Uncharacterized protein n=1 Tax=Duffyella gerundensis TaxID=1619313 RepID=A0A0U5LUA9_9GAMM|nr:hypothetical protein EM595_p0330 [Duffyella gerundensis]